MGRPKKDSNNTHDTRSSSQQRPPIEVIDNDVNESEHDVTEPAATVSGHTGPVGANGVDHTSRTRTSSVRDNDTSKDGEQFESYVREVVTATVGLNRTEDQRFIREELERTQAELLRQVRAMVRETLASVTPNVASNQQDARTLLNMNTPPDRVPDYTTQQPIVNNIENVNPSNEPGVHPVDMARGSNVDNFLAQLSNLNFNVSPPPASQVNQAPSTSSGIRFPHYHKWGIKFDNKSMSIDDFLFRLERVKDSYYVTWPEVVQNFHHFVSGSAMTWYWTFIKSNPSCNWPTLRLALVEQYRSLETDSELYRKMSDRKQLLNESFDSFYDDLIQLNSRLRVPKTVKEIIELIKLNVRRRIGELLVTFSTHSLPEMVYVCRTIEKFLNGGESVKPKYQSSTPLQHPRRQIAEIDSEIEISSEEAPGVIEAYHREANTLRCWNCRVEGHSFRECDSPKRNLFCYRCGRENVITPRCDNCSGNRQPGNPTTGGRCPRSENPEN